MHILLLVVTVINKTVLHLLIAVRQTLILVENICLCHISHKIHNIFSYLEHTNIKAGLRVFLH